MTFTKTLRRSILPATLLAGFALAPLHASAQTASFCGGQLVADSVYTTVTSNGAKSRIDYFMQLRNASNKPVMANVQFTLNAPPAVLSERLNRMQTLAQYQSTTLKLASQTVNNPSGQGAVSRETAAKAVLVTCQASR